MRNREEKSLSLIREHLERTEICLNEMKKAFDAYLAGKKEEARDFSLQVDKAESEADNLRREIAKGLFEGAFLPLLREDFLNFVEGVDKIADEAESCCDLIMLETPDIPEDLKFFFAEIVKDSIVPFQPLKEGFTHLFEDFSLTLEKVQEVNIKEAEVDQKEEDLTRKIFSGDLELARKILLKQLVIKICDISDRAEDASDKLEILAIKRRI